MKSLSNPCSSRIALRGDYGSITGEVGNDLVLDRFYQRENITELWKAPLRGVAFQCYIVFGYLFTKGKLRYVG